MPELPAQPDHIDVERIMEQIRARIEERSRREKALAAERERETQPAAERERETQPAAEPVRDAAVALPPSESFAFDGDSIYWSSRRRGVGRVLYGTRKLLAPLVKFVFNIDPMVVALAAQASRNAQQAAFDDDVARRLAAREKQDLRSQRALQSLTAEMERLAADMKSQGTLLKSVAERLDALERARHGDPEPGPHGGRPASERADDDAPPSPPAVEPPPPNR